MLSLCSHNREPEMTVISVTANFKPFRQLALVVFPHANMQGHSDLKNFPSDRMKRWDSIAPVFANWLLISVSPVAQKQVSMGICCGREIVSSVMLTLLILLSSSPFHNKDVSIIFLNIRKKSSFRCVQQNLAKVTASKPAAVWIGSSEGKKRLGGVMQTLRGGSGVCEGRQIEY